jgi:hypothetical protein
VLHCPKLRQPLWSAAGALTETLSGVLERVTYHNLENGFCVLRVKARVICSPQTGSFLSRVFRAILPWLGGAENDEGIEVFGCAEGIYSEAGG